MSTTAKSFSEHSPKGASSAERWMNCPGSHALLKVLDIPPSDESEFAKEGTGAHDAAAHCLQNQCDTWEIVGQEFKGVKVDDEMAEAIQLYLQEVRELEAEHVAAGGKVQHLIEERISDDNIDVMFYGTVDNAILSPDVWDVTDFKYGVGIAVEAEENPQLKYYAVGLLARAPDVPDSLRVRLRIVQPRAFHVDGPVRVWETTAGELRKWRDAVLIPAMAAAEIDTTLTPGSWCRFCPAKLACPMLGVVFRAMATKVDPGQMAFLTDAQLGAEYVLIAPAKLRIAAIEAEMAKRLMAGRQIAEAKLVQKKANRVFTTEGGRLMAEKFGAEAWTKPELKSPAEIDKLGPEGKKFTREYAYSPNTGFTIAPSTDTRVAVKVTSAKDAFASYQGPAE